MKFSRHVRCWLLVLVFAAGARATTVIYPVGAIDDLWKYPADEFREKYAGINVTGLDVNDEGWYVRYRHENLTYFFGPIADREEARKKMWDLETVRDAAIRNRPSLSSSQIDFVKFSYSGVYGAAGNTPFTGKKGAGQGGGDGDQSNGTGSGANGRDDQGGSAQNGTDKAGKGNGTNGNGSGQDGSGTIAMDSQGNMIGEKLGSLDGSGQGGQGSQGSSQKGGKGSQNSQRTGAGANSGQSGQAGQNGQMASSGGQQGGQSAQSASQSSSGSSGQSGGQAGGSNSSSSSASNSSQGGANSGSGQPSQGGGGSGGGSGQPGGGGNPLQLLVGLLRGILGL